MKYLKTLIKRHREFKLKSDFDVNLANFILKSIQLGLVHGASPNDVLMYRLTDKNVDVGRFVTMKRHFRMLRYFNPEWPQKDFLNKIAFNNKYKQFISRRSARLDLFVNGDEYFFSDTGYIIKPVEGEGGNDIHYFAEGNVSAFASRLNDQSTYIIEEALKNHKAFECFGGKALSTIRIGTINLRDDRPVFYPGTIQRGRTLFIASCIRFGAPNSYVDNLTNGGIACPIDLESGIFSEFGFNKYNQKFSAHPQSGELFAGHKISNWQKCLYVIEKACGCLPENTRYIGWDISITDKGDVELMEANDNGSHRPLQLATPNGLWPLYSALIREGR